MKRSSSERRTGAPASPLAIVLSRPFHIAIGCLAAGLALAPARSAWTGAAAAAAAAGVGIAARAAKASAPAPGGPRPLGATGSGLPMAALAAVLVLLGAAVGDARLRSLDAPMSRIRDGRVEALRVYLVSAPRASPFGSAAEVEIAAGPLAGARVLMRSPLWARLPAPAEVGRELLVTGRMRRLRAAEGGRVAAGERAAQRAGFDFAAHLRRRGVAGELLLERARATRRRRGGMAGVLDRMRRRAESAVAAGLPRPEAALARGMVLGQEEEIDETTRQDWRDSGLAHLLAVSGQNVMLLVALAVPLLSTARLRPAARGIALLALVAVYVPLAGAGPSLQRAGVMGAAGIAAMTLSRPASRWYALLLAAAVTLALNPRAGADPGWQLSFAAVAGILAIGRPLAAALTRTGSELIPVAPPGGAASGRVRRAATFHAIVRGLVEAVAITFAATVATAPLVAHHFGAVPLAGLAANLLALPAVAPAMWLGMVKGALGIAGGALPPADSVAELLGPVTRIPLAYLERLAERCAGLEGSRVKLPLRSPPAVCVAYSLIALPILLARVGPPRFQAIDLAERAAAWRRAPRSLRVAVLVLALSVLGLVAAAGLGSPAPPGDLTIRFLDIGQGDATLIQDGHGASVLFDAGPPEAGVYRDLRRAGVRQLDLAVSTHTSRDHHGGFHQLIDRMPIRLLVENGYGTHEPDYRRMLAEADARGIRHVPAEAGQLLRVGGLRIEILGPRPHQPGAPAPEDPNPIGVAAIVSAGAFDLWLSADAESDAILDYPLRPVEAMKVSHHGSADPGLPDVLDRLRPRVAAIEVGAHNTYGHPAPSTLSALRNAGVPTYRTDQDGTVTLTVTHGQMEVTTER